MFIVFNIGIRLLVAIICTSIAVLLYTQLHKDAASRPYRVLLTIIALFSFSAAVTRITGLLGITELVDVTFKISTLCASAIGGLILISTIDLVGSWNPLLRWVSRFWAFVHLPLSAYFNLTDQLNDNVRVTPDAFISYARLWWSYPLLLFTTTYVLIALLVIIVKLRKGKVVGLTWPMILGIILVNLGPISFVIPSINKYSFEMIAYAIGSLLIIRPILHERLFDPLSQLNRKLTKQTEQLRTINRVGQQINSILDLEKLLPLMIQEIQRAFSYDSVAIFLAENNTHLKYAAHAGVQPEETTYLITETNPLGLAAKTQQITIVENPRQDKRFAALNLQFTGLLVALPLLIADDAAINNENKTIGVLEIYRNQKRPLSEDDTEVLNILSRQIAAAIHNAELYKQAEEAKRLADSASEAKTRFLSIMNHELRTPLQSIISTSRFVQNPQMYGDVAINDSYVADLTIIEKSGKRLLALINNILDMSKIEAEALEMVLQPVNPILILKEVEAIASSLLKPDVTINASYSEDLPFVLADDIRLSQILTNLVSNAAKFTEQGQITLNAEVQGNKLLFSVKDTGMGIPAHIQPEIFKSFQQATPEISRKHGGSGLGLNISKRLVEMHNGEIWFESSEGEGSVFYFTIPVVTSEELRDPGLIADKISQRVFVYDKNKSQILTHVMVIDEKTRYWDQLDYTLQSYGYKVLASQPTSHAVTMAHTIRPAGIIVVKHPDTATKCLEIVEKLQKDESLSEVRIQTCDVKDEKNFLKVVVSAVQQAVPIQAIQNEVAIATV